MDKYSYLSNADVATIETFYQNYLKDENSVEEGWRRFFEGFEFGRKDFEGAGQIPENIRKEFAVINLINEYRMRGHLFTQTNPVRERRKYSPHVNEIDRFGLSESDMDTVFQAGTEIGIGPAPLKEIIALLKQTYCRSIGVEFMYVRVPEIKSWLLEKMEGSRNMPKYGIEKKRTIFRKLNQAVIFEHFLHTKFVGQKRFSLEGAETLIPAMNAVIEKACELGVKEFVLGMAHRGRLNVLANILNKTYKDIFTEFEGKSSDDSIFDGDVKYHLGYSSDIISDSGNNIHLSLARNPSHLEAVDPVVQGVARAKIDAAHGEDPDKVVPILIHGDAAIAGQGIVYEVLQMSQLEAHKTGGTIHLVINNQVGFTTNYTEGRSSTYCTDVAKVVLSPVFHVNGDDVEALTYVCELAMEFRQRFNKDVFIDILCYRKYGHNEGDEPRFTQPLLYKAISKHPNPRKIYAEQLQKQDALNTELVEEMEKEFKEMLQEKLDEAKQEEKKGQVSKFLEGTWEGLRESKEEEFDTSPKTAVTKNLFLELAKKSVQLPEDGAFFNKSKKLFKDREKIIEEDRYDWAMGELMAYATLLQEGHNVRISGQDVERGTFSHRHAVITMEDGKNKYIPLQHLSEKQGKFRIYNSLLSEYGVLGFEYGYASAAPHDLVIWEAQFGDFFNGAQIVIDQFLSSAEYKWRKMNGLVLLLPHGYEGMGPEHSSARLERFLQLCGNNNMQIVNCTTPANFFHVLRRQLKRDFRKPLIVFTPKSLLRHPKCISSLEDFTKQKSFQELIDDNLIADKVKKVILCSGKIYYDLLKYREEEKIDDIALIRMEQIYPLPKKQLEVLFKKYDKVKDWVWVQEEPENMGAWSYLLRSLGTRTLKLVSRKESASPATGYFKKFQRQQKEIIQKAFDHE